jgi:hypothetical protein
MKTAMLFASHEHLLTVMVTELLKDVPEFHFIQFHVSA